MAELLRLQASDVLDALVNETEVVVDGGSTVVSFDGGVTFDDLVEARADSGESYTEIFDDLDETYDKVDAKVLDERCVLKPALRFSIMTANNEIKVQDYIIGEDETKDDVIERVESVQHFDKVTLQGETKVEILE